jgi:hypothetical protein
MNFLIVLRSYYCRVWANKLLVLRRRIVLSLAGKLRLRAENAKFILRFSQELNCKFIYKK